MIALLSPSKSMDMEPAKVSGFSQPQFIDRSKKLVGQVKKFTPEELMEFMAISEKLAVLNRKRFREWKPPFSTDNAKQALFAFTGDVYEGLQTNSLGKSDIVFAQDHLRILSGLYGLLRPLDLIQPYRLEMGRPLEMRGAKNLYEFWKPVLTEELNRNEGDLIVNLASNEYSKAIDRRTLDKSMVSPVFKDEKNGTFKIISFFAKKARGAMARFIIQERITDAAGLLDFAEDGYRYSPELSTADQPVFTRPER
ncbi:MAG: peroxide stress protein YaaA [Pontiella sp.]|nr:peroxide stress protein YaaA [Pontiella sp.]